MILTEGYERGEMKSEDLLEKLVSFKPVTAETDRVNAVVGFLKDYLEEAGVFTAEENLQGRRILYAATVPEKQVDCMLNAHLDVVPAPDEQFVLQERDGWLYGRGTADCLGNAAIMANALIRLNGRCRVGAIFSTDEETGGETTRYMAEKGDYGARKLVCIVDAEGNAMAVAQKGVLTVTLKAEGEACHAAEPWSGQNALDRLVDGYVRVRGLFPTVSADDQWHDTMVAAICQAGTVANRVPDRAEMTLNIRYTTPGDQERILQEIRAASGLEVRLGMHCQPVVFSEDTPVLRDLRGHLEKALDREIRVYRLNGATDARHFVKWNVPIALLGIPGRDLHGPGEGIELAGYRAFEAALEDYLLATYAVL